VTTTSVTEIHAHSTAATNLVPRSRPRATGRIRRDRRFPHDASPAIASPPNTATTMTSRNTLMSRSADAGITQPLCVERNRSAAPPGPPSPRADWGGFALIAIVMITGIAITIPKTT
jgi:hypothetical protein